MNNHTDLTFTATLENWLNAALQHVQANNWLAAENACQQALQMDPNHAEVHHLAGHVAGQMGNTGQALEHLVKAIAIDPQHPQYRYNYAVSLGLLGRENEAAVQYQACLRHSPTHRDALWNYGEMLRLAENFDLAAMLLERFAANGGNYPALHHRLAVTYGALRRDEAAESHFLAELNGLTNARPDQADDLTHWEYSLFLLSRERFAEGFAYYRRRFNAGGRNSVYCHTFPYPHWQGVFTHNSTLLIHGEQGLGDEMMFASVVPELLHKAAATASQVVLAVKPPLVRLFKASFPTAIVVAHRVGGPVADLSGLKRIDWQLPMGDLLELFRFQEQDFRAASQAYLFADPERTDWYRRQLELLQAPVELTHGAQLPLSNPIKLRVGLMWGSNPAAVNAKFMRWSQQRSISVQLFERLANLLPNVQFVSLQNAERGHEAALAPKLDILDLSHLQTDFLETACLIANLDLVISVDTSVAHLAGAMGKETWVPLMHRSDWRHGNKRKTSYWYANTQYFQQSDVGDWAQVLQAIADELALRVDKKNADLQSTPQIVAASVESTTWVKQAQPTRQDLARAIELLGLRDFDNARPYFESALAAQPDDPAVRWEYAMQLLTEGHWGRGWDFHEARLAVFGAQALHMCALPWPQWRGEPLQGRTIVVHGEQGVGDEIMYLSMLPDLLATQAHIILACVPSLVQIFQFSFPGIKVVAHPRGATQNRQEALPLWAQALRGEQVDFQVPVGSLGVQLRRSDAKFPRQSYLRADPTRVARMANVLDQQLAMAGAATTANAIRVGLAWCGSLADHNARARSMPIRKMKALVEICQSRGWPVVSLQSRQFAKQADEVPQFGLIDMSEYTDDFADLAAVMVNLDLVISIDTSYAHLSAALGVKTWRMVIRTCDWRWGWGTDASVWYPNDRLFRQQIDGDWDDVIQRVASELKKFTGCAPI